MGAELLRLHREGYSYSELAKPRGMTSNEVKGIVRTARLKQPSEFDVIHLGTPPHLVGDAVIVGDPHVPCTDWEWACRVSQIGERLKINRLIIAGDFFNFDMFSSFKNAVPPSTWRQERDAARVLIGDWLETFSEIYTLQGNHDRRLQTWCAGQLEEADIWGMVNTSTKLHHTNYGYILLTSGGRLWRITHPKNYGRNQLTLAGELALKFDCNIISSHEHHSGVGHDVYNRHAVVNIGTIADDKKFAYVALEDSRMPAMVKSFVVVRDGYPTLYDEGLTDWGAVLN